MDETVRSIRMALVDAIGGEHRLRRQALEQQRDVERWEQRASLAEMRDLPDLAAEARQRAERHRRSAALHEQRAAEMRVQVERLRAALAASQGHGRAPPLPPASIEGRFATFEAERELERIREEGRRSVHEPNAGPVAPGSQEQGG